MFLRSLKTQGILNCEVGANPTFMLPTNSNQDKIYFSNETWIPKVAPGDIGYDESNSTNDIGFIIIFSFIFLIIGVVL